jgi:hypothetical protein
VLRAAKAVDAELPVIVMTAAASGPVSAMKQGRSAWPSLSIPITSCCWSNAPWRQPVGGASC